MTAPLASSPFPQYLKKLVAQHIQAKVAAAKAAAQKAQLAAEIKAASAKAAAVAAAKRQQERTVAASREKLLRAQLCNAALTSEQCELLSSF